jgi:Flp pilus assembly protein TadD
MSRALIIAFAAALALAVAGCGGSATKTSATQERTLTDLQDISQLRSAFQKASGEPRLVVLVSPT